MKNKKISEQLKQKLLTVYNILYTAAQGDREKALRFTGIFMLLTEGWCPNDTGSPFISGCHLTDEQAWANLLFLSTSQSL